MKTFELSCNNSGGLYWIGRKEIDKLKEAGWYIKPGVRIERENYLGSGCTWNELRHLRVERESAQVAIEEFEEITGQNFFALGCTCCGAPFRLEEVDGDGVWGGDYVRHEPQRPF